MKLGGIIFKLQFSGRHKNPAKPIDDKKFHPKFPNLKKVP